MDFIQYCHLILHQSPLYFSVQVFHCFTSPFCLPLPLYRDQALYLRFRMSTVTRQFCLFIFASSFSIQTMLSLTKPFQPVSLHNLCPRTYLSKCLLAQPSSAIFVFAFFTATLSPSDSLRCQATKRTASAHCGANFQILEQIQSSLQTRFFKYSQSA